MAAGSLFLSKNLIALLEGLVFTGGAIGLSDYGVIRVLGPDAQDFLNNQTTNNVKSLSKGGFQLDSLLDRGGKLVCFFLTLKENDQNFYLIMHKDFLEVCEERLGKYLIAEEVEIEQTSMKAYCVMGLQALEKANQGFIGNFAGEDASIVFEKPNLPEIDAEEFKLFSILVGYPWWKETIQELELLNNTRIADLGYNKDKGCFLGQETVSKIESRRGAAFKPALLELSSPLPETGNNVLRSKERKLGKILAQSQNFVLVSLNRESRIEGLKINIAEPAEVEGQVRYLPVYKAEEKASYFYHYGVELFQEGKEREAERYLLKAIQVDPAYEDPYESLGVLYGRQERFEEAIEYMRKLSQLNEKSVMAHTNMSLYYMKLGEIEKAEEEKSKATVKQFQLLGEEAETKRRLEEEEKKKKDELVKREQMFREVLEIDSEDTLANYGLGEIEFSKGNFLKSIELLSKTIEHKQNYSVAWLALGKAYVANKEEAKAREVFKKGIGIAGKNGDLMPANEMQRLLDSIQNKG